MQAVPPKPPGQQPLCQKCVARREREKENDEKVHRHVRICPEGQQRPKHCSHKTVNLVPSLKLTENNRQKYFKKSQPAQPMDSTPRSNRQVFLNPGKS